MFTHAITRKPAPNFASGLTTTSPQSPPDYPMLLAQHRSYIKVLVDLGLEVIELPELTDYPDAYFVEDTAVITPEIAVLANPGAPSRRGEPEFIIEDIARLREVRRITEPGRLDGGDVLQVEDRFFIGISERTNLAGAEQLGTYLQELGYSWQAVTVGAGLHLKSSVNYLGEDKLIITGELVDRTDFSDFDQVVVPIEEAYAANTLAANGHLLTPQGFPRTHEKLDKLGKPVIEMDVSEVAKMDGGLTCLSLRF